MLHSCLLVYNRCTLNSSSPATKKRTVAEYVDKKDERQRLFFIFIVLLLTDMCVNLREACTCTVPTFRLSVTLGCKYTE